MTDSLFKLDPLIPVWLLTIFCVAAISVLIVGELRRNTRLKLLRVFCIVLLILSLAGTILRPSLHTQTSDSVILLTDNAAKKIIDSLKQIFPETPMLYLGDNASQKFARRLSSVHEIPKDKIRIIVGKGLSPGALDILNETRFNYLPASTPEGVIALHLPGEVKVLQKATILGTYHGSSDSTKIILEGPGGKEDSVTITSKGSKTFALDFLPKEKGKFSYSLLINGERELIPINVFPENQLRILVVQTFPTFETGYLKNLLSKHHKLVFRYQLSKNNFRYEYINHEAIRTDRLTTDILKGFDLVILDSDVLSQLSSVERKNVELSVNDGLGILIVMNEQPKANRALQSLLPVSFKSFAKDSAGFFLDKRLIVSAWPVEAINDGRIVPTIQNSNRILAGYVYKGFGKIGFQLFQETYKLTLEGDSASYKNLWTTIVQKNARSLAKTFQINVKNDFPVFENEPVTIEVIGTAEHAPTLLHNGTEIPLIEDLVIDDLWTTKIWTDNFGWQNLQIKGDSATYSYFVCKQGSWKALAAANSIRNTRALASTEAVSSTPSWEYKPFATWLFFLLFLLSAAVLWLVPKI